MSYCKLNYHVVFSTKERAPWLREDVMGRLCQYVGGIVRGLKGDLVAAGGAPDHLHLVAVLDPQFSVSETLRTVKANSSKWIHENFPNLAAFAWQDGYAAFTVSHSVAPRVVRYVEGQKERHKKMSFKDELIALLKAQGIPYDERYLL